MKRIYLKFGAKRMPGMRHARFNGGGGSGGAATPPGTTTEEEEDPDPEHKALFDNIRTLVLDEIRTQKLANGDAVTTAITSTLTGLDLEALRKYKDNKTGIENSVRKLSAQFKRAEEAMQAGERRNKEKSETIREVLDANWAGIEKVFRTKGKSMQNATIELTTRAAATMVMGDAVEQGGLDGDENLPQDILESFSVDAFVKKRRPVEFIWELVNRRTVPEITEYKTWLEEGDEDGAFAIISEGQLKPLMSKKLVRNVAKYRKAAGKRVYTEEFSKFRKEAYRIIEDLFNDQIMRNYNAILTTSLLAKSASYVGTSLDGQYDKPTDYHAIGAVASQIETLDFFPDLLLLNPQDKWRIGLSQNDQGTFYMNIPMYNPSGEVTMLGFRVFTSNRVTVGTAILGESRLYKVEDEPVQIRMGYGINVEKDGNGFVTEVESDVDHNRFRIIAETFFHNYICTNHTGSYVKFNFADVKSALQTI